MPMETVQIRLTKEQLKIIDEKVKRGKYPSRSEAIRDYVRKAEFLELFNRFLDLTSTKPVTQEDLERIREKVWREEYTPRLKRERREKVR